MYVLLHCRMDGQRIVKLLEPPSSCKPGDQVEVEGFEHSTSGGKVFRAFHSYFFSCHLKYFVHFIPIFSVVI